MDACRKQSGFTLIEMIITVAVIVILAAMVIGVGGALDKQSRRQGAKNLISQIEGAIDLYYDFNGSYPRQQLPQSVPPSFGIARTNNEMLYIQLFGGQGTGFAGAPGSKKVLGLINSRLIRDETGVSGVPEIYDPWDLVIDYAYDPNTDSYPRLISAGPDKYFGTEDDITNR